MHCFCVVKFLRVCSVVLKAFLLLTCFVFAFNEMIIMLDFAHSERGGRVHLVKEHIPSAIIQVETDSPCFRWRC
jgi:hypothetical protein